MVSKSLVLLLILFRTVFSNVYWYIKSSKIELGGNVTLFCNTSDVIDSCKGCPANWFGGKNRSLLAFGRFTASNSKYFTTTATDGFGIIIKNLSETDLNVPYICSFGFYSFERNLTLDDRFEYQPSNDKIDTRHQITDKSMLNFHAIMEKVHPVPLCTAMFNHENVTSGLKPTIGRNGPFYRASYHLEVDIKNHSCKGRLQMRCRIGLSSSRLIDTYINYMCNDGKLTEETIGRDGIVVLSVLLASIVITLCCIWYNFKLIKHRISKFKRHVQSACLKRETEEKVVYVEGSGILLKAEEMKPTKNLKNIDGKKIKFADEAEDSSSDIEINTRIGETILLRNNSEIDNFCENGQNHLGTSCNDTQK